MRVRAFLLAALMLTGCGSAPVSIDPPRLKAALEAESDGAKRYGNGNYATAARRFDEAIRLYASIDDTAGAARNRLHLARADLALGRAEAALEALASLEAEPDSALAALLLKAQAQLALNRRDAAQQNLAAAEGLCAGACQQLASLRLLQARSELAAGRAAQALTHAETALKLLQDRDEPNESGNAWRLVAAARLAANDAGGALPAARAALDIDRKLALPEKIARDWLLIGDIQVKVGALALHARDSASRASDTAAAYRHALDVANAAGLAELAASAGRALAAITGAAGH